MLTENGTYTLLLLGWLRSSYEKDPESGLYYAGARYQEPRLGSFNSTDELWHLSPDKTSYHYCSNNPIMFVDPDGNNPIDPRTGKEISMNLYCAAVYDNYENKRITPVLDKSLYNSAKPYNYQNRRQFNKPDGMWTGATYNERGYNLSNLSSGAYAILSNFFPDNKHIDASYETPNDYMWMQMAEQGSYVFVDNAWDESLWLHSTIKSFNIITVTENRITQIINLTRGSGKDKYNVNGITSFDIFVGDIQSRQKRTWLGGSRTEQYRILNVIETTKNYKNNQPYGTPTVKTYQTEELVK